MGYGKHNHDLPWSIAHTVGEIHHTSLDAVGRSGYVIESNQSTVNELRIRENEGNSFETHHPVEARKPLALDFLGLRGAGVEPPAIGGVALSDMVTGGGAHISPRLK